MAKPKPILSAAFIPRVDLLLNSKDAQTIFPWCLTQTMQVFLKEAESSRDEEVLSYEFNRKLLFQILVMANSQLAELIGARGPNVNMNAACASSAMAIAIAEDWIRVGRASRVIVVGADSVTSHNLFQYVGTGFLALGAASTKGIPEEAALPFSRNRNGLVLGAVGRPKLCFLRSRRDPAYLAQSVVLSSVLSSVAYVSCRVLLVWCWNLKATRSDVRLKF